VFKRIGFATAPLLVSMLACSDPTGSNVGVDVAVTVDWAEAQEGGFALTSWRLESLSCLGAMPCRWITWGKGSFPQQGPHVIEEHCGCNWGDRVRLTLLGSHENQEETCRMPYELNSCTQSGGSASITLPVNPFCW
jgi:hypothetical protein